MAGGGGSGGGRCRAVGVVGVGSWLWIGVVPPRGGGGSCWCSARGGGSAGGGSGAGPCVGAGVGGVGICGRGDSPEGSGAGVAGVGVAALPCGWGSCPDAEHTVHSSRWAERFFHLFHCEFEKVASVLWHDEHWCRLVPGAPGVARGGGEGGRAARRKSPYCLVPCSKATKEWCNATASGLVEWCSAPQKV